MAFSLVILFLAIGLLACSSGGTDQTELGGEPTDDDQPIIDDDATSDDDGVGDDDDIDDDATDDDEVDDDTSDDDATDDDGTDDDATDDDVTDDDAIDDDAIDDDTYDDDDTPIMLSTLMVGNDTMLLGIEEDSEEVIILDPDANANVKNWNDIWFRRADEAWVVGETFAQVGAIMLYRDGYFSRSYPPNLTATSWALNGVAFPFAWRGYAVGVNKDDYTGIILKYDRTADEWVQETNLPAGMPAHWVANGVTAVLSGQVMVVGYDSVAQKGIVLRKLNDESDWELLPVPSVGHTYQLYSVTLLSADDGWAVGDGVVLHWNGTSWSEASVPNLTTTSILHRVDCSILLCYAVGEHLSSGKGIIYQNTGSGWTQVPQILLDNSGDYGSVWGLTGIAIGGPWDALAVGFGQAVVISKGLLGWDQVPDDPAAFGSFHLNAIGVNP